MAAQRCGFALIIIAALWLAGCSGEIDGVPGPRAAADNRVAVGRQLIASYGCGACHTIPGIPGADAKAGPPLDQFYQRSYIAGRLPNTEANLAQWIQNPQQIDPGNAMPNLGVTADQAQAMAAYLYHQPSLVGP